MNLTGWGRSGSRSEPVSQSAASTVEAFPGRSAGTRSIPYVEHSEDERIKALTIALNAERLAGFPSGRTFLESIELALTMALRQGPAASSARPRKVRGGLAPFRLHRVLNFIETNLERDLTLQDLADAAGLSISHLSHMFRSSTSLSPHRFILQRRVQKAGDLMRGSDLRVFDIALACGFKTQQHFARAFRRVYGVNPTEYRNLLGSPCCVSKVKAGDIA